MPWLTHLRAAPISAKVGLAIILAYAVVALFAPWLAPFSEADAVGARLQQHELAVAGNQEVAHLIVAVAGGDALAHQHT